MGVFVGVTVIAGLLRWPSRILPAGVFGGANEDAEEGVEPENVEYGSIEQQHDADIEGDEFNGGGNDERDELTGDPDYELDAPVGDAEHGEYVITERVTDGESSLQGVGVRALDKDLTTEGLLTESTTTERWTVSQWVPPSFGQSLTTGVDRRRTTGDAI
jgi:hypothetical protein